MNFNFGEVLTRAWQIIWKHKVLWIFGILASCGRGGGSGNGGGGSGGDNGFSGSGPDLPPQVMQWLQWIENNITTFIAITIAVLCIIWLIVAFLSTIGKIGLIRGTAQAEDGAESLIVGQLFSESMPYFWRMFGLSLILTLPVLIVVAGVAALVAFGVIAASTGTESALALIGIVPLMLGCCCLLIPVMFVVGMVLRQSERAIVLEEMSVLPAISRGWDIFRANLGSIILMAIILAIIGFVVGLVVALPIIFIVFPAMLAFIVGGAESTTPLLFMGICFCLYLPVLILLNGIMVSYIESAWTLTYLRLTGKPQLGDQPKLDVYPPAAPEDNNKTLLAREPIDDNKTIMSKKPDA